ncbi:AraC family transcriptional regulator [Rhizobium sp. RU36D]|uniref:AraC family transcriptional regulator n=1 Tax=Rhizobium sp. RU36D TaxID=1907415 RepID=UPI0009D88AE9|nr:AraC family transcriptional regulator [Rhizobium sp. RU36D]SMC61865.1 transcriptional regulator, AraC family [Rhizobium sp. RU36D]
MAGFRQIPTGLPGLRADWAESSHAFPRHSHDEYGIGVMLAGGQLSASGRGQVTAGPGDVITVNPGEVHDGIPAGGMPRRWAMFYLTPGLMAEMRIGLKGNSAEVEFEAPVLQQPDLCRALKSLQTQIADDDHHAPDASVQEGMLHLLSLVIQPADRNRLSWPSKKLRRVKEMIDDDPTGNPSLDCLALEAGLTRFQTLRAFQRATGFTPHAYIMQPRFDLACGLLRTSAPLAEIAVSSGYSDQSHMNREFKRRYGLTPLAYRTAITGCNSVQDRATPTMV